MKPESLAMVKQYQSLFQPIIERGGYVADKSLSFAQMDPVNFIIPGLIRVGDGDIEGVPAGDYPLETIKEGGLGANGGVNTQSLNCNLMSLSLSENIKALGNRTIATLCEIKSLLLPSTLENGNIGNNFNGIGCSWISDPNTAPDSPVNTGLGTQPNPVIPPPTPTTQSKLLSLYYPLTMPYYLIVTSNERLCAQSEESRDKSDDKEQR